MDSFLMFPDLHCNSIMDGERKRKILQLKHYADMSKLTCIFPGDTFDVLEFGWERILEDAFCMDIFEWAMDGIYLEGNHNRKLPDGTRPPKYCVIDSIYISHWHQFDLLWGFLPLDTFWLPDKVIKIYKTPSKYKKGQDYHLNTLQIEYVAQHFLFKNFYDACMGGHTHSPFYCEREGTILANGGDSVDSFSFLKVNVPALDVQIKTINDI